MSRNEIIVDATKIPNLQTNEKDLLEVLGIDIEKNFKDYKQSMFLWLSARIHWTKKGSKSAIIK